MHCHDENIELNVRRVMKSKGQSALEFLMTYGWAIMIVLVAIGALAYFGVLNPANFISARCVSANPFSCQGKPLIQNSNFSFTIANGIGNTLNIAAGSLTISSISANTSGVTLYECPAGTVSTSLPCVNAGTTAYTLNDGGTMTVVANGTYTKGASLRATLNIAYPDPRSQLLQSVPVQVSGKVN